MGAARSMAKHYTYIDFKMPFSWEIDDKEEEFEVHFVGDPGSPGRLTGHPDSYYPADPPDVEWTEVHHKASGRVFTEWEFDFLLSFDNKKLDDFRDDAIEYMMDNLPEPDYDDYDPREDEWY